jgi:hypothetical protein
MLEFQCFSESFAALKSSIIKPIEKIFFIFYCKNTDVGG